MTTNKGLGRGLSSLIPPKKINDEVRKPMPTRALSSSVTVAADSDEKYLFVKPAEIAVNPMQPRKEFSESGINDLMASIKEYGIIQPLIVSRKGGLFELIAGERRLRAAKNLKLNEVPVIVREIDEQRKLEVALVENIQREDLNPMETAVAYQKLMDEFDLTQEDVAGKIGKSRSSVANTLRFLSLPQPIQSALSDGRINEGHAKYLLGLDSEAKQMSVFKKVINNGLTVRGVNKEIRRLGGTKKARIKENYLDSEKILAFREFFGAKTEIKRGVRGGQVVLYFYSDDELNNMIEKIK